MCGLDFAYFRWPNLPASRMQSNFYASMVFNIEVDKAGRVTAWADNFGGSINGRPERYGNGQIHLSK
jgi:hypothetical protein